MYYSHNHQSHYGRNSLYSGIAITIRDTTIIIIVTIHYFFLLMLISDVCDIIASKLPEFLFTNFLSVNGNFIHRFYSNHLYCFILLLPLVLIYHLSYLLPLLVQSSIITRIIIIIIVITVIIGSIIIINIVVISSTITIRNTTIIIVSEVTCPRL